MSFWKRLFSRKPKLASPEFETRLGNIANMGIFAVVCCGCMRILMKDNSTRRFDPVHGEIDSFRANSKPELDAHLRRIGWYEERGNHRCPRCGPPRVGQPHGAYIDTRLWTAGGSK